MNQIAQRPYFGLDIGGSLAKLVYFEPRQSQINSLNGRAKVGLEALQDFIESDVKFGEIGTRDERLSMENVVLAGREGRVRFVHFPTDATSEFLLHAREFKASSSNTKIAATGGGAFKFEDKFQQLLGIQLEKYDEFECLVRGLHFINSSCDDGCYYWNNLHSPEKAEKVPHALQSYPYLVVTIGSGVSVLLVESAEKFKAISGTTIGGGTFLGLCSLLTGCKSFEEAVSMAEEGDSSKVDKSIRDIYGGKFPSMLRLPEDTIACSFGKMCCEQSRSLVNNKDLARALMFTIINNIAILARTCAISHKTKCVLFAGSFLHGNTLATKLLASTMDSILRGTQKVVFLKHEGYLGACGALLKLMNSMEADKDPVNFGTINGS